MNSVTLLSYLLYLLIFVSIVIVINRGYTIYRKRGKELNEPKEVFQENEAHALRELNPEEKKRLEELIRRWGRIFPIIFILSFLIPIFILTSLYNRIGEYFGTYSYLFILLISLLPLLIVLLMNSIKKLRINKMKQDLDSSVFQVKGRVDKRYYLNNWYFAGIPYTQVIIRNALFDGMQNISPGKTLYNSLKQNEEVVIEYSPHSKWIWKVEHL